MPPLLQPAIAYHNLFNMLHCTVLQTFPAGKKKSIADYAIVRRIHFIFERAVRRFRSDLSLWTAWLEFCRASNSNRRLGRVVGRALQASLLLLPQLVQTVVVLVILQQWCWL
jgi:hypothetical protein